MVITDWVSCDEEGYISLDDLPREKFEKLWDFVVEEVRKHGYKFTGTMHQYAYSPVIDNKYLFSVSMRSWGAIMQEAYNLPNEDGFGYVLWAWCTPNGETPVYPEEE